MLPEQKSNFKVPGLAHSRPLNKLIPLFCAALNFRYPTNMGVV